MIENYLKTIYPKDRSRISKINTSYGC